VAVWRGWERSPLNYTAYVISTVSRDIYGGSGWSNRAESKSTDTRFEFHIRESGNRKPVGDVCAIDRNENASDVDYAVQQVVFDFERQEGTARSQHTKGFAKGAFLSGSCAEVMQHQNSYS